jgi:plastocyanin
MYNAQGFSPATVTIAKGGTVTWVNQSGAGMWVASDQHPSHTGYAGTSRQQHCPDTSGTAFDQCAPGDKYSFTFSKTGTWGFHNHVNATANGTVIVK